MPCFGDVPVGAHFESMNRVWTKLDERHAQDESGETQLFWDIAPVEPAELLVSPAPEPAPAPVEPQHEEVQAEVASDEEVKPEEGQAEVAPAAEATEEKVDLVVKSKGRRNS